MYDKQKLIWHTCISSSVFSFLRVSNIIYKYYITCANVCMYVRKSWQLSKNAHAHLYIIIFSTLFERKKNTHIFLMVFERGKFRNTSNFRIRTFNICHIHIFHDKAITLRIDSWYIRCTHTNFKLCKFWHSKGSFCPTDSTPLLWWKLSIRKPNLILFEFVVYDFSILGDVSFARTLYTIHIIYVL